MPLRPASATPLLVLPQGLVPVGSPHPFTVPWAKPWGRAKNEQDRRKAEARQAAGLAGAKPDGRTYLFVLRVYWRRELVEPQLDRQRPDVENAAKVLTDAFIGYLYEDDDLRYVCGVQTECFGVPLAADERTDVWIYAVPPELLRGSFVAGGVLESGIS